MWLVLMSRSVFLMTQLILETMEDSDKLDTLDLQNFANVSGYTAGSHASSGVCLCVGRSHGVQSG